MRSIRWIAGVALLLAASQTANAQEEVPEGKVKVCATRSGVAQAGAHVVFFGAPLAVVDRLLSDSGCAVFDPSVGPYAITMESLTTLTSPLYGDLTVCLKRADLAVEGQKVTVIVPPSTVPLTADTASDGCAVIAPFAGVYGALTMTIPLSELPAASAKSKR